MSVLEYADAALTVLCIVWIVARAAWPGPDTHVTTLDLLVATTLISGWSA